MNEFRFTDAHMRAILKAWSEGIDALTDDERVLFDELSHWLKQARLPESELLDEAQEAFERLSPDDRRRYGGWTPQEFVAFLPLIEGDQARLELARWFAKILDELDEDHATDPDALSDLQHRIALAFAQWRAATGYGMRGPGTGPESPSS